MFYRSYNTIQIGRNEKGTLQNFTFGWFSIASKPHVPNKIKSPLNQALKGILFLSIKLKTSRGVKITTSSQNMKSFTEI